MAELGEPTGEPVEIPGRKPLTVPEPEPAKEPTSSDIDTLREAARLMRERALAATPGPWSQHTAEAAADTVIFAGEEWVTNIDNCPSVGEHMRTPGGSVCSDQALPNGDHIAGMHPGVALAVADWLDMAASYLREFGLHCENGCKLCNNNFYSPFVRKALAVARAYPNEIVKEKTND